MAGQKVLQNRVTKAAAAWAAAVDAGKPLDKPFARLLGVVEELATVLVEEEEAAEGTDDEGTDATG